MANLTRFYIENRLEPHCTHSIGGPRDGHVWRSSSEDDHGTEAGVLAKVGANRADVLIAATGADDVNLVTCQLAMHKFDVSRTISIVNEPENETLFRTLGVGAVVNITDLAIAGIQENLSGLLVDRPRDSR